MTIKFCGIRTVDEARIAMEAGADRVGLIFVPNTPRQVNLAEASRVAALARGNVEVVGVFQNQTVREIEDVLRVVAIDILQFHGNETASFLSLFDLPIIRAVGVDECDDAKTIIARMESYQHHEVLLDRKDRGRGRLPSPTVLREVSRSIPFILSGGLTPGNLSSYASSGVRLLGVDVSAGVRTSRTLDPEKCRSFVHLCRSSL